MRAGIEVSAANKHRESVSYPPPILMTLPNYRPARRECFISGYLAGRRASEGSTLARLVPAALDASRSGAVRVNIELPNRRVLDGDMIRRLLTRWVGGAVRFVVDIDARRVFHRRSGATFQIDDGDKLSSLSDRRLLPSDESPLVAAVLPGLSTNRAAAPRAWWIGSRGYKLPPSPAFLGYGHRIRA